MNLPSSTPENASSSSRHPLVWAVPLSVVGVLLIAIISGLAFAHEHRSRFEGQIYPGVSVNQVDMSGLRTDEAQARLQNALQTATKNGLTFQLGTTTQTLPQAQMLELIRYDYPSSVAHAYSLGREGTTIQSLFRILGLSLRGKDLDLPVTLEENGLRTWLHEVTTPLLPEAKNARLVIDLPTATSSLVRIEAEQLGQTAEFEPALQEAKRQAETQQFYPIQLTIKTLEPAIRSRDLEPLQTQATTWLTRAPFDVTLDQKKWSVSPALLASWITATSSDMITIALDSSRLKQDITPWISSSIRIEKDGKLILDEN
jgi:hypothetical protein